MKTVYLVGLPGAGKTTLMREARKLAGLGTLSIGGPVPYLAWPGGRIIELGKEDPVFGGTDKLAMDINPRAVAFMRALPEGVDTVVAEGDRLANSKFFTACAPNFALVNLAVDYDVARARSAERSRAAGRAPQNEAWWKGRGTKLENLLAQWPHLTINGSAPLAQQAEALWLLISVQP